jgi:type I restriction enzyme M protein
MDQATHNKIVSFIWGIADDVLRDLFKRGKYLTLPGAPK